MKQGRADKSGMGSVKREPISRAVNPAAADQLGQAMGNMIGGKRVTSATLYEGKGYSAPMSKGCTAHKCGSQGKH
jgi:hypothetical protein